MFACTYFFLILKIWMVNRDIPELQNHFYIYIQWNFLRVQKVWLLFQGFFISYCIAPYVWSSASMLSECQRLSFCYDSVLHVLIRRISDSRRCKSQASSAKRWVKMACCHSWILTQELIFSFFLLFFFFFFIFLNIILLLGWLYYLHEHWRDEGNRNIVPQKKWTFWL